MNVTVADGLARGGAGGAGASSTDSSGGGGAVGGAGGAGGAKNGTNPGGGGGVAGPSGDGGVGDDIFSGAGGLNAGGTFAYGGGSAMSTPEAVTDGGGGGAYNFEGGDGTGLSDAYLGGGGGGAMSTTGGQGGFGGGGGGGGFRISGTGGAGGFGGGGGAGATGGQRGFGASSGGNSIGGTYQGGGGAGFGGANFNHQGTVNILNSTFTNNSVTGGSGDTDGQGLGGAVFNYNGELTIDLATFYQNIAEYGGAVYNLGDDNVSSVVVNNSILYGSTADIMSNSINSGGFTATEVGNLIGDAVNFSGTIVSNADPKLGALADNGGPTRTFLPASDSPALEAGDLAAVPVSVTTDQRGEPRTNNSMVDIGAVQATQTSAPEITSGSAASFAVGSDGTFIIETTGSPTAAISYTEMLPTGLTFIDNGDGTATITGTPAAGQAAVYNLTITAANGISPDDSQAVTLTVYTAISLSTSFTPGAVDSAYSFQTTATGGSGSGYTYSATGLPAGLSMNASGLVTGTPTSDMGSPFTVDVTVTDGDGNVRVVSSTLAINPAISATPASLAQPAVGSAYTATLTGFGGLGTGYTFSATGLPTGLAISAGGVITGTPTGNAGSPYTVLVTVTDSNGATGEVSYSLTVNPALDITHGTIDVPTVGSPYSLQLSPTGGSGQGYTFSSATLPPGLSISSSGLMTGTPTTTTGSPFTVLVTLTDDQGASTVDTYTIPVNPAISISPLTLPNTAVGNLYAPQLTASGGSGQGYAFSATGLPNGLMMGGGGQIMGYVNDDPGVYTFTVTVVDDQNAEHTQEYEITVYSTVAVTPASLPTLTAMNAFEQQFTATGGSGQGYVFSVSPDASALPPGLSLSPEGLLIGTPTTASLPIMTVNNDFLVELTASGGSGSGYVYSATGLPAGLTLCPTGELTGTPTSSSGSPYSVIVTAVGDNGGVGTATYSLVVNPALAISPATLPTFVVGTYYSQQLVATGGSGQGYVYSLEGGLPPGLTLSESGLISGIPTSTEGMPFGGIISVLDNNLASTRNVYEFTVRGAAVTTTIASSAIPSSPGQSIVFTASVAATTAGLAMPSGSVSFMTGTILLGVVPLVDGVATFSMSGLEPGPHPIFAVYNGDSVHAAARSSSVVQSVLVTSATTFAASPETAEYGRPVVFTMTVASYAGLFPTGLVGF
ncbi:putative Ig domain-containing protein [Paludisphaera soli]|uniref:putative Ig domain-containing protein n=1 Tax=Paludisphaera soli TaxID=2712865 RepID=UPI0013EDD91E|nr:putative Ig domain-containing protein [Paludisphaera soli]